MLGKYEDAMSAYDRVLFVNENSHRAKLEMARCYLKLGNQKKAKELFLEVRDKVPANVQKNVDSYLAAIETARKKHSVSGAFIAGFNYDTNIYSLESGFTSDKTGLSSINNTANISALAHQEVLAANYAYFKSDTVKYKIDTVLFNKTIFSHHDMDLHLMQLTPAASINYSGRLIIDYALFFNKIWLRDNYLMSNWGLNPKFKYLYSPRWTFDTALKLQIQSNNAQSYQRDNTLYSFEAGVTHIYTPELTLGAKIKYDRVREKNSREKDSKGILLDLNEVAYNQYDLTLNATYKYSKTLMIAPKLKYYDKRYIDASVSPLDKVTLLYPRNDKEYQMAFTGTYIYNPKMLFVLEYIHSKHDSNYVDNQFDKDSISANMIIPF
jgi:hypothetical protein